MAVIKYAKYAETRPKALLLHLVSKTNNTEYKYNWADLYDIF